MKSRFLRGAGALTATVCLCAPLSCGSTDANSGTPSGGQANAGTAAMSSAGSTSGSANGGTGGIALPPGTSSMPKTIQCGGDCSSARAGLVYVDPCCGSDNTTCGVDTTYLMMTGTMFKQSCEPQHQPGELNEACPSPTPSMISAMGATLSLDPFPGCCRPNGTCGVQVNTVTAAGGLVPVANLALGCVDAASFFPGTAPMACSNVAGGAAGAPSDGAGGAAGAPSDGAGGAP